MVEFTLHVHDLSPDSPHFKRATMAVGALASESLKKYQFAVLAVDVLGQVRVMPLTAVRLVTPPKLADPELDELEEERAIQAMLAQGDTEEVIASYLAGRDTRKSRKDETDAKPRL